MPRVHADGGDGFGDGVFDLEARVHFQEEEAVGVVRRARGIPRCPRPCSRRRVRRPQRPRPWAFRCSGVSSGEGASSTIFWWRRWRLHSRSPRWMMLPCVSARTCTSMWRGRSTNRSRNRVASPKAARRLAAGGAGVRRVRPGVRTRRMPLPPPPAEGLMSRGKPTACGGGDQVRRPSSAGLRAMPGTTGTPAAATVLGADLVAHGLDGSGAGPTKASPAVVQSAGEGRRSRPGSRSRGGRPRRRLRAAAAMIASMSR